MICFVIYRNVIFAALFRRLPTLWNWTLKMTTMFLRCLKLFISTLKYTTLIRRHVEIHNVVSTLIWRCLTSWRCIKQKTTLKQRWNVCTVFGSSCPEVFCKKPVLKIFWKFNGKNTRWTAILELKSQHSTMDFFLGISRKFQNSGGLLLIIDDIFTDVLKTVP